MRACRRVIVPALVAVTGAGTVRGQAIRTTLLDAGSRQPIAGAFVLVVGDAGREVARTLTDESGRVSLDVPAGHYRFVVLRIGLARWSSPPFTLTPTDTVTAPLRPPAAPVRLSAITVHAERRRRPQAEAGVAVTTLWEEARKALEATEWTITHPVYRFRSRRYVRTELAGEGPVTEERRVVSDFAAWPFASIAPESLAAKGYAQPDSEHGTTYYGLDLPVLLSPTFLDSHCFRVVPGRDVDDSLVGLGFEPIQRRRRVDVAGVLWLDLRSAALQEIRFHYTNLGAWTASGAVGRVIFDRLPNGAWVIRRWSIRMPMPRIGRRSALVDGQFRVGPIDTVGLAGYREEGGWVAAVLSAAGVLLVSYPEPP